MLSEKCFGKNENICGKNENEYLQYCIYGPKNDTGVLILVEAIKPVYDYHSNQIKSNQFISS